jgi:NAD(P)-dependent dehydrogenase (short-subunit alcohol dehydrogenase family)
MERAVLVTEAQTPVGAALVRLLLARGLRVAAAVESSARGGEGGWPADYRMKPFLSLPWNRRSPVSAHNLLAGVRSAFGSLEEALILEPPSTAADAPQWASADIEKAFDDLKGSTFLARELLAHFMAAGSGILSLASSSPRSADQAGAALEQAAREGFHGLASSLLAPRSQPRLLVNGYQAFGAEPEEFAAFIDRTLEEKGRKMGGRWFTLQPRGGPRGRAEKGSSA